MTSALCLNCGKVKFGALCPCHICKDEPEGEADLLLFFTDHFLPQGLLKPLGEDLNKLKELESNENLVIQAFLLNSKQYFSEDIQEAIVSEGDITEVEELLKKANLPVHTVEEIVVHEKSSKSIFILIILGLFSLTIYLAIKVIIKLFN